MIILQSLIFISRWGQGEVGHMFHDPPENIHDREGRPGKKKEVGWKGFLADKITGFEGRGKNKKVDRTKKDDKKNTILPLKKENKKDDTKSKPQSLKSASERLLERRAMREAKKQLEKTKQLKIKIISLLNIHIL